MEDYGILQEVGQTRKVYNTEVEAYGLYIGVAKPELLRDKDEPKPFFFYFVKKDSDEEYWRMVVSDTGFANLDELEELVKEKAPTGVAEEFLENINNKLNVLAEPEFYFRETETSEQKKRREMVEWAYRNAPGNNYKEKNKYLLETIATELNLPLVLLPGMPDYTQNDRPLLWEEIQDDMENRSIMAETALFPVISPDLFDELASIFKEKSNLSQTL